MYGAMVAPIQAPRDSALASAANPKGIGAVANATGTAVARPRTDATVGEHRPLRTASARTIVGRNQKKAVIGGGRARAVGSC